MNIPEALYDINLSELQISHIYGLWDINITIPGTSLKNVWLSAQQIRFSPQTWQLLDEATGEVGTWHFERPPAQTQPRLLLLGPHHIYQALVTRFRQSLTGEARRLLLYFPTGLEIELTLATSNRHSAVNRHGQLAY